MAVLSGGCLCGAVSYTITGDKTEIGACHCSMCRRFSGGVFLGLEVRPEEIVFEGHEHIGTFTSSDWAERGFCRTCGSSLFYRLTVPGPQQGVYHVAAGTLSDQSGLTLTEQLFIDIKPPGYSFAEQTHSLTQAEVEALFGGQ